MKKAELSSTEKLLEQIRGESPPSVPPPGEAPDASHVGWWQHLRPTFKFRKSLCVGVDIGYADIHLIKTSRIGVNRFQILDYRRVPFDNGIDPQNIIFPQFLRRALDDFIDSGKQVDIWATVSSARLDVRLLRIPKVGRRQIPNAVIGAYKKKAPAGDKQRVFDFEILADAPETDSPGLDVLAYTIPREDIEAVKFIFQRAGYPLDGVSTYPFLLQNLLRSRWKILGQGRLCALYVGRNWSRIDIFNNGNLMLSRGIRAGMSGMIAEIDTDSRMAVEKGIDDDGESESAAPQPLAETAHPLRDTDPAALLACLAPNVTPSAAAAADALGDNLAPDDVFDMIKPALDRLVRQVERTISHYSLHVEEHDMDRLCVSGMICESEQVRAYLAEQLGMPLIDLNPFENEKLVVPPSSRQAQLAYIPATGLASPVENRTPNFLQTYHERAGRESRQFFNVVVFGLFLLTMTSFLGYSAWQKHQLSARHQYLTALEERLNDHAPLLNPETVLVLAAKAKEAADTLSRYRERYTGMALIAELARRTPADVTLTRMTVHLARKGDTDVEPPLRLLSIEGIVQGERFHLEPSLAAYLVEMKASPLLSDPKILTKSFELLGGSEVLRFTAELEVL